MPNRFASPEEPWQFTLYSTDGDDSDTETALGQLLTEHLSHGYTIRHGDIAEQASATDHGVLVVPTIVRTHPQPERRIVGAITDPGIVAVWLGLTEPKPKIGNADIHQLDSSASGILDLSFDGVLIVDSDGLIRFANQTILRIFALTEEELVGRHFGLPTGSEVSEVDVLVAGEPRAMVIRSAEIRWDDSPAFQVHLRDTSRRKRARSTIELQTTMLNSAGDSIIATDIDGTITFWNRAAESLYGWQADEVIGRNVSEVIPSPGLEAATHEIMAALASGQPWSGEFLVQRRDRTIFTARVVDSPILDGDGQIVGIIGVSSDVSEIKQKEHELQRQYALMQNLIDTAPMIVMVLDSDGTVRSVNRYVQDMTGHAPDDLEGTDWISTCITTEHRASERLVFQDAMATDQPTQHVSTVQTRDGGSVSVAWSFRKVSENHGTPDGLLAVGVDITEEVHTLEMLATSERKLREAQSIAHVGHWEFDIDTMETVWSEEIFKIYGIDPERGEPTLEMHQRITYPDDWDMRQETIRKALEDGTPYEIEFRLIRPDGEIRWLHSVGRVETAEDGTRRLFGVSQDVTKQKRAERELEKLADVVRNMPVGLHLYRLEDLADPCSLRLIIANDTAEKLTGRKNEEILGLTIVEAFPGNIEKGLHLRYAKTARGGSVDRIEAVYYDADGVTGVFSVMAIPLVDRCVGVLFEDISERIESEAENRRLEAQMQQSQKMESIGRLAGGVAHDFNNMLTAISGYADFIDDSLEPDDPLKEYVDGISAAADSAAKLTVQLLAFSRKQLIVPTIVDLNSVLKQSKQMLGRLLGEDIALNLHLYNDLGLVKADAGQIIQVIVNLAVNSRDAMSTGGVLTFETKNTEIDDDQAHVRGGDLKGEFVVLKVSDTGTGIPDEHLDDIFEPFFTTKAQGQGTGLGLSTVYGIVRQNHGYISVSSEVGVGTVFHVHFPRTREDATLETDVDRGSESSGTETILVIEDQENVRNVARMALEQRGYAVLTAGDGQHALKLFATHKDAIDLVLTDVVMPGMSGKDVVRHVHEKIRDLPVIYMSGYTQDVIALQDVLESGAHLIEKPFLPADLAMKVREVLDSRSTGTASTER